MKKLITMVALAAISFGSVYATGTMQTDTTKKSKKDTTTKKTPPPAFKKVK
jgi:hypothetical protein